MDDGGQNQAHQKMFLSAQIDTGQRRELPVLCVGWLLAINGHKRAVRTLLGGAKATERSGNILPFKTTNIEIQMSESDMSKDAVEAALQTIVTADDYDPNMSIKMIRKQLEKMLKLPKKALKGSDADIIALIKVCDVLAASVPLICGILDLL